MSRLSEVRASPYDELDDTRFRASTDSTGWYRMELPVGSYYISILPPHDPASTYWLGFDTVRVGTRLRRFDLDKGQVRVHVTFPSFLERRIFSCDLNGSYFFRTFEGDTVKDGAIDHLVAIVYPGIYYINISTDRSNVWLWLPGTTDRNEADRVEVGVGSPTVYEADLRRMSEVAGSVHGSWEQMHTSSPTAFAYGGDSTLVGSSWVSSDGSFAVDIYPPQPVRLRVGSSGSGSNLWVGGDSYETATVYDLEPGGQLGAVVVEDSGILCRLDPPPAHLYDVRPTMVDSHGRQFYPYSSVSNGEIAIPFLPPGRYFLRLSHDCGASWAPTWYDGSESIDGATPIEIAGPGETAQITFDLVDGGRIEGSVRTASGGNPGYIHVVLFQTGDAPICESVSDAESGQFEFRGLANGTYTLAARTIDGYWWYAGTDDPAAAQPLTIANHETASGIDWSLPQ